VAGCLATGGRVAPWLGSELPDARRLRIWSLMVSDLVLKNTGRGGTGCVSLGLELTAIPEQFGRTQTGRATSATNGGRCR